VRQVLSEPRFVIVADPSHHLEYNTATPEAWATFERARMMFDTHQPVALFFGDRTRPYLRIDPDFTQAVDGDVTAREALDILCRSIDAVQTSLVLKAGDFCFIDNYLAVHGRGAFTPKYDGRDRWLKRVNVTRNLRTARAAGACGPGRRVI
jgi:alpha-ketoglutarate-dependent taurine dioxygenase